MRNRGFRPKRQRSQQRRLRKLLERRTSHSARAARAQSPSPDGNASTFSRPLFIPPTIQELRAPDEFSLLRDPEPVIAHLDAITALAGPNRTLISDMSRITEFTTDALIAMIAIANDPDHFKGALIQGRSPTDPQLADKFKDSGIFGPRVIRFADGGSRLAHGTIFRVTDKSVRGETAKSLIHFASERIFGRPRRLKGVYTTMIECMNNTYDHAAGGPTKRESWWATVYCDADRRIAFFNFVDTGIGILESIRLRIADRILFAIGLKDGADLMREVLEGKIGSRTGLNYRGNGLPQIVKRYRMGQLSRLILVTNDVYVNLDEDEYRVLRRPFHGTLFHWEINYDEYNDELEDFNDPDSDTVQ